MNWWKFLIMSMCCTICFQVHVGSVKQLRRNIFKNSLSLNGNTGQLLSSKTLSIKHNNESHSITRRNKPNAQKVASNLLKLSETNSTAFHQKYKSSKISKPSSSSNCTRETQIETNQTPSTFDELERNKTIHYYRTMKERLEDLRTTYLLKKKKRSSFSQLFSIFNKNPNTSLVERNDLKLGKDDKNDNDDNDYSEEEDDDKARIDNKALIPAEPRTGLVLGTIVAVIEAGVIMVSVIGFGGLLSIGVLLFIKILIKLLLLAMVGVYLL